VTRALTEQQHTRERSVAFALVLDAVMIAAYTFAAIAAGSLTMVAELIRGVLMTLIEVFALMVMRRIHRGRTAVFEFGSGKLEQLVNLLIAGGLLGGALWIAIDAVQLLAAGEVHGRPAGFALAAIITGVNTYVNVLAWDGVWRAARGGGSLIMQGQLQARVVKLVSSACVLITLSIAALSSDGVVILWADAIGALLVTGFIVHAAVGMIKSGLPDLVDLAVNEEFQAAITRMLARHFDDYDQLGHVRTRRAGDLVHVEIELGFRPDLTIGEVTARIEAMKTNLRQEVGHADISILAMSGG
jgi:cation diffusion facilitator family transporter